MATFVETPRFPEDISYGSRGGPAYNTQVIEVDSGAIIRNSLWTYGRYEYDVAYGVNTITKLETLLYFFHAIGQGRAVGFRYKDWLDYKSCVRANTPTSTDVHFATGDGVTASFQLYKGYLSGSTTKSRPIYKPVSGTVLIAVAGATKSAGTHYNVNYATGSIVFTAGNIPTAGQLITAGFEFDVPVCFATDKISINLNDYGTGATQVPLIELKYGDSG